MALRQRLEKKGVGAHVKAKPGHSDGIPSHTIPINKSPHAYSVLMPSHAMPTNKYAHVADNMHVQTHSIPINNNHPIMNLPIQTMSKSKQQISHQHTVSSMAPRIGQPPLDVAVPSSHSFGRLWPHPSLDFDVHRQKIVSKKNQVAVSRHHLCPHLNWKKSECFAVADVIEVPPDLFQLKDLKDILNIEVWKGCLSPLERRFLRGLLPEGADNGSAVHAITRGDNFSFGNPLADWGKLLLKGELHPDFIQQKELELKQAQKDHYQEIHRYHDKMLETLKVLKEQWISCKTVGRNLVSKPKRRKTGIHDLTAANNCGIEGDALRQKRKRQKVESRQQASGRVDLLPAKDSQIIKNKHEKVVHHDDCTQSMHILKVTQKQYADVLHLMKGKGDELPLAALSSVLNCQQKLEINCANGCDANVALKTHEFWSKLVEKDIPAAYAFFSQRKMDKERLAKSAAEQCLQYCSVFRCKVDKLDLHSRSNAISLLDFEKSFEADVRNSSTSESSVTCLEEQAGTQAAVESCLSSDDCSRGILSQHSIQEEQVSLINLPNGSSLVSEGQATLLPLVQVQREGHSFGSESTFDPQKGSSLNVQSVRVLETDALSECNEGSVVKHTLTNRCVDVHETKSSGIDLVNNDLHSKPGSEVVSAAAAASGESEEVEQRVIHQSGGNVSNGLDHQLFCLSGPSTLLVGNEEPTGKSHLICSNYTSSSKVLKNTEDQVVHHEEKYHKVNEDSAPSTGEFTQSDNVHTKEYRCVFEMDHNQADREQNNQMMLQLFLDPKSHSSEFLSIEASSNQEMQGKNTFLERDEAMPLASHCNDERMLKEHEPITELSLLVDDRSAKQSFLTEQADSVSSRTGAEFVLNEALEPHWMVRNNKQDTQVYPFHQNMQEIHQLAQSSQDAYSPHSFTSMLPVWSNPQLGFTNHWNMGEGVDQMNWASSKTSATPMFSWSKEEGGRASSASHHLDQLPRGPSINNWSTWPADPSVSFLRRATHNVQDEQYFQVRDNWAAVHSQPSNHLPHTWAVDRSGRMASHPWKNASLFSHLSPQCEQHKVQNVCLSKMAPNFSASWH